MHKVDYLPSHLSSMELMVGNYRAQISRARSYAPSGSGSGSGSAPSLWNSLFHLCLKWSDRIHSLLLILPI